MAKTQAQEKESNTTKSVALPQSKNGLSVVAVGEEFKNFTIPSFTLDGVTYTHEEAAQNTELLNRLATIGFGGWQTIF